LIKKVRETQRIFFILTTPRMMQHKISLPGGYSWRWKWICFSTFRKSISPIFRYQEQYLFRKLHRLHISLTSSERKKLCTWYTRVSIISLSKVFFLKMIVINNCKKERKLCEEVKQLNMCVEISGIIAENRWFNIKFISTSLSLIVGT
jgi:hypothetical protein